MSSRPLARCVCIEQNFISHHRVRTKFLKMISFFRILQLFGFVYLSSSLNKVLIRRSSVARYETNLFMGAKNRAWAKGDLSDKDIFDEGPVEESKADNKQKYKLTPEITFFEGPPSATEIIFPALSIITVIGIVPFVSALARQAWVRYKFTSRRINIKSGIGGKDETEIIYRDIDEIRFVYRAFGSAGDMVMFLKDGAKVELRHVPNFSSIYSYVLENCDEECKRKSMKLAAEKEQTN